MISKNFISQVRSLHIGKNRAAQKLFIAEGEKVVRDLLLSDYKIKHLIALPGYLDAMEDLPAGIEVHEAGEDDLKKISTLSTPNRVIAIAEMPGSEDLFSEGENLVLFLDEINDPGNMGTMLRTAEWFGVRRVVCSPNTVNCYNPKVVMGAMGSLFRIQVVYRELTDAISYYRDSGFLIYAATLAGMEVDDLKIQNKMGLVIGSESHGIHSSIIAMCDEQVSIPKATGSGAESLNAAVATGILLSKFCKP